MSAVKIHFTELEIESAATNHPVWQIAEAVHINKYWSGVDAGEGRHTEARLVWTPGHLLIRFECEQSEPLVINDKPFLTKKTIGLWEKDVCEAFIAPDSENSEKYMEFEAAPTGEWLDLVVRWVDGNLERDWAYRSGMECAAQIFEEKIIIVMKIPWKAFGKKPEAGEKWRGNLFRQVGSGKDRGYLAWQPTLTEKPSFHVPNTFGWFEFVR